MDDITDQLIDGSKDYGHTGNTNRNEPKFMDFRTGNDILSEVKHLGVGYGDFDHWKESSTDHYENGYRTYSATGGRSGSFELSQKVVETVDTPHFYIIICGDYTLDYSASYFGKQPDDIGGVCDFKQTLETGSIHYQIVLDENVENPPNRLHRLQTLLSSKGVFNFDLFNIVNGEIHIHNIIRQEIILDRLRYFQEFTRMHLDQFTKNTQTLH